MDEFATSAHHTAQADHEARERIINTAMIRAGLQADRGLEVTKTVSRCLPKPDVCCGRCGALIDESEDTQGGAYE